MWHEDEIARMRQAAADDPKLTVRLCDMLVATGQADEAVAVCRQRLKDRPEDVDLRLALGRALSAAGNLEEAQAALFDAVARKRRSTLQNVPVTGAGQNTPPPARTPTPVLRETPVPRPDAPSDGAVPLPIPAIGTARHAIPAPVPTPVATSGTSRHYLPNPLLELPRPRLSETPVPVGASATPSAGLILTDTAQHRLAQPPPLAPPLGPPVPVGPLPAPARFHSLPTAPDPALSPPRKLPPLGPPSRRPFAPLPPSVPRFPGSPPRAELPRPAAPPTDHAQAPQRASGLHRPPLPPPAPLPAELAEPLPIKLPSPAEEVEGERSDQPSLVESVLAAAAETVRSSSKASPLPAPVGSVGPPAPILPIEEDEPSPQRHSPPPAAPTVSLSPAPTLLPGSARSPVLSIDQHAELPAPLFDLEQAAQLLLGRIRDPEAAVRLTLPPDREARSQALFDRQRSRIFTGMWIALLLVSVGVVVGWATRAATTAAELKRQLLRAGQLAATARYEDDLQARDLYMQVLRMLPRDARGAALAAEAEARLAADHGEGTEDSAFVLLGRAQQEVRHARHPDPETLGAIRRTEMLLSLAHGEPCPVLRGGEAALSQKQDDDVAARCAWQRGDIATARQILAEGGAGSIHLLLFRGALTLSLGDLEEADHAYRTILDRIPQHPRALIGRALVLAEQGRDPLPLLPQSARLGLVTESWWYLMYGVKALQDGNDEAAAQALDRAQAGWRHDARLALAVAKARLFQGRVAEAEAGLRMAQRRSPSDPDLLLFDAEVALAKGYEERVVRALLPLLASAEQQGPRLLSVLGRAQYRTGDYHAAAETLGRVVKLLPSDLNAVSYEALCRARLGDETEAFHQLELLGSVPQPVTTPHYALAVLSYERKDLDRAAAEAARALQRTPDAAQAHTLLARVLREQGKVAPALAEVQRVVREAPSLVAPHRLLGRSYLDLGRAHDARDEMLKVVQSGDPTIEDYMALLDATLTLGLPAEAAQVMKEARRAGAPAGKLSHANLVLQSLQGAQQALSAARQLEAERKANQRDVSLTLAAAAAWQRAGDLQSALDDYETARAKAPMAALLGIGRAQLRLHSLPEAEAAYRAAMMQWPKAPYAKTDLGEARAGLARALQQQGSSTEAAQLVQQALKDTPDSVDVRMAWARLLTEQGQTQQALKESQRAVELEPANVDACVLWGDLTFKLKDQVHAKERYEHCLTLNPAPTVSKYLHGALSMIR